MKTNKLLTRLGKKYPYKLADSWDFCGFQCGKKKEDIHNILLCLDFDDFVFDYLKKNNLLTQIDLIITHHPYIFGKKKQVLQDYPTKIDVIKELEEHSIAIYSYHTCFDTAKDGMNDALAKKLDLINIKPLLSLPMARGGHLKEKMNIFDFAKYAKEKFNISYGLLINGGKSEIESVAIIGGGGSFGYKSSYLEGYDIYISGDAPHYIRRDIVNLKYNYLDLPHEIEKIFIKKMKEVLLGFDSSLNIITFDHEKEPLVI